MESCRENMPNADPVPISLNTGLVQINTGMNSFTLDIVHYLLSIKCLCSLSPQWAPKQKCSSYLHLSTQCPKPSWSIVVPYRTFVLWGTVGWWNSPLPFMKKVYGKSIAGWYPRCSNIRTTGRIAGSFKLLCHPSFITSNPTVVKYDKKGVPKNGGPINFMLWTQVLSDKHHVLQPPLVLWGSSCGHLRHVWNQKNVTVIRTWATSTIQVWTGPSERHHDAFTISMTLKTGVTLA